MMLTAGTFLQWLQPKSFNIKFVFFEKATKFDEISILLLTNNFLLFVSRNSFE